MSDLGGTEVEVFMKDLQPTLIAAFSSIRVPGLLHDLVGTKVQQPHGTNRRYVPVD